MSKKIYVGGELVSATDATDLLVSSTDDTGTPWEIPYIDGGGEGSLAAFSEDLADAVAAGLSAAGSEGIGPNVVQTVKTDVFTSTSATYVDITGFAATITPSSNTSKILVVSSITAGVSGAELVAYRILRGTTSLVTADGQDFIQSSDLGRSTAQRDMTNPLVHVFVDSPNTTSAITYKGQIRRSGSTVSVNRSGAGDYRGISTLTLIEVAP
jgi:hypothetical protein